MDVGDCDCGLRAFVGRKWILVKKLQMNLFIVTRLWRAKKFNYSDLWCEGGSFVGTLSFAVHLGGSLGGLRRILAQHATTMS